MCGLDDFKRRFRQYIDENEGGFLRRVCGSVSEFYRVDLNRSWLVVVEHVKIGLNAHWYSCYLLVPKFEDSEVWGCFEFVRFESDFGKSWRFIGNSDLFPELLQYELERNMNYNRIVLDGSIAELFRK